jgi:hypothetical protein
VLPAQAATKATCRGINSIEELGAEWVG